MTDDQLDLARRLAARPRFEWRAGMLALEDPSSGHWQPGDYVWRIASDSPDLMAVTSEGDVHEAPYMPSLFKRAVPDLTDDATGGVLLVVLGGGLVLYRSALYPLWSARRNDGKSIEHLGSTLAEVCARALLAEWGES